MCPPEKKKGWPPPKTSKRPFHPKDRGKGKKRGKKTNLPIQKGKLQPTGTLRIFYPEKWSLGGKDPG